MRERARVSLLLIHMLIVVTLVMCVHHKFFNSTLCCILPFTILKYTQNNSKYTRSCPAWPYVYYGYRHANTMYIIIITLIVTTFEESEA